MTVPRKINQIHASVFRDGRKIHVATIRSDWTTKDYEHLNWLFPKCYIRSANLVIPLAWLGMKGHHTDFLSLRRKKIL